MTMSAWLQWQFGDDDVDDDGDGLVMMMMMMVTALIHWAFQILRNNYSLM